MRMWSPTTIRVIPTIKKKLREKQFSLGEYDNLYLCFSADIPAGSVVLDENGDKNFPWFRNALVGISGLYLLSAYGRIRSIEQA